MLRSRKSFTLLELMVAFIIMAILTAVAVPSLANLVAGDQQTGDNASAIAVADTASLDSFAASPTANLTVPEINANLGSLTSQLSGTPGSLVTTNAAGDAEFTFKDHNTVCVSLPSTGATPQVVTCGSTGPDLSCSVSGTSTWVAGYAAVGGGFTWLLQDNGYSGLQDRTSGVVTSAELTCTGVAGPEVNAYVEVGGDYFSLTVLDADYQFGSGSTSASLPSSFSVDCVSGLYTANGGPSTPLASDGDNSVPSAPAACSLQAAPSVAQITSGSPAPNALGYYEYDSTVSYYQGYGP